MLTDLTRSQKLLAEYMSNLFEEAYAAAWMEGLEFALWQALKGQLKRYGRLAITGEIRANLKQLSNDANGWIFFDEQEEERHVSFEEWERMNRNM